MQNLTENIPAIYTAHSKLTFFCRDVISEFVLQRGALPLNPFRIFDYFLGDRVERDLVRRGNNNLVRISDETWVFGDVADGVFLEIQLAIQLKKPVRYFTIGTRVSEIVETAPVNVQIEEEVPLTTGLPHDELVRVLCLASRHTEIPSRVASTQ